MNTIDDVRTANLKSLVEGYGGTSKFAERVGKSSSQVSQWLNRSLNSITQRPRVISTASCREIEKTLGLPTGWMDQENPLGSETSLYSEATIDALAKFHRVPLAIADDDSDEFVKVRMVTLKVSAGIIGFRTEPGTGLEKTLTLNRSWIDSKGFNPDALVAVKVHGESMEPSLFPGDTIVINTADTALVDGAMYAVNYEGEAVVKRLVRDAGDWWLTSDNPDQRKFHRKICRGDDCLIVGRVVRRETDRL